MKDELTQLCQQVHAAREAASPLYIRGGDSKRFYGEPARLMGTDIQTLDMSRYRGVIQYEPSELVITARAGTPLSEIEATVAQADQMLAFEPPRFSEESTLGGCVASGLSGPRRMAVGGLSDFVLGARLLSSTGELLSFGGEVMKNVAGYDVSRLLAGSLGSLGPIVELSVKVVPRPPYEQTCQLEVTESEALALMDTWRGLPLPISATVWQADPDSADESSLGRLHVRISGSQPAVLSAVAHVGGQQLDGQAGAVLWDALRDQTHPFFKQRPLWRIAVPPSTKALELGPSLIEWNGALRWVSTDRPAQELRSKVSAQGGHATLYRYDQKSDDVPVFHPLSDALERINRRMMEQLDPAGIFNPGRLFPVTVG